MNWYECLCVYHWSKPWPNLMDQFDTMHALPKPGLIQADTTWSLMKDRKASAVNITDQRRRLISSKYIVTEHNLRNQLCHHPSPNPPPTTATSATMAPIHRCHHRQKSFLACYQYKWIAGMGCKFKYLQEECKKRSQETRFWHHAVTLSRSYWA